MNWINSKIPINHIDKMHKTMYNEYWAKLHVPSFKLEMTYQEHNPCTFQRARTVIQNNGYGRKGKYAEAQRR